MTATILQIGNLVVLPFWFMMIFLPHVKWARRIVSSLYVSILPAALYLLMSVLLYSGQTTSSMSLADFATLTPETLAALFSDPYLAVLGWMHYLAFDLWVGRWIYLDGIERGVHPILRGVAMLFTFLLGPIGYLLYLLFRQFGKRSAVSA
ncbi:MAG: ABA4-like family protein [Phototrophicaceae bacterium]